MYEWLNSLLGLNLSQFELTFWHLMLRMLVIYVIGMITLRWQRQFMSIRTPFNYMLNIIVGSVFANAIVGTVPFVPVLLMAFCMSIIATIIATISFYVPAFEKMIQGSPEVLIQDGKIQWNAMRRNLITKDELMDSVHRLTHSNDISQIETAYFENSGRITFIIKRRN